MKADLAKLRALHEAATPGEWAQAHRESRGGYNTEVFDANGETIATLAWHAKPPRYEDGRKIVSTDRPENAALIVAAVNALPELLAIAEAVERDAKDAARYRWLRAEHMSYGRSWHIREPTNTVAPIAIDAAIDAAIDGLLAIGEDGNE